MSEQLMFHDCCFGRLFANAGQHVWCTPCNRGVTFLAPLTISRNMYSDVKCALASLIVVLTLAGTARWARAQAVYGNVIGTVTDPFRSRGSRCLSNRPKQ